LRQNRASEIVVQRQPSPEAEAPGENYRASEIVVQGQNLKLIGAGNLR
jgi:hypothetical protein